MRVGIRNTFQIHNTKINIASIARNDTSSQKWFLPLNLTDVVGVPRFVAREEELTQIHNVLRDSHDRCQTAILQGLGGMGKTQLAVAYAKRHHKDYTAIIWLNARDETSLKETFCRAAKRILTQHVSTVYIQNAVKSGDPDQMTQAVRRWLGETQNSRWLIIYDNYDEPRFGNLTCGVDRTEDSRDKSKSWWWWWPGRDISTGRGFDIRPFFPDSCHGAIIITTRSSIVKFGEVIRLEKLRDIYDSLQILASTSHRLCLEDGKTAGNRDSDSMLIESTR